MGDGFASEYTKGGRFSGCRFLYICNLWWNIKSSDSCKSCMYVESGENVQRVEQEKILFYLKTTYVILFLFGNPPLYIDIEWQWVNPLCKHKWKNKSHFVSVYTGRYTIIGVKRKFERILRGKGKSDLNVNV